MAKCVSRSSLAKFCYAENVRFKVNYVRVDEIRDQPEQNWNITETQRQMILA